MATSLFIKLRLRQGNSSIVINQTQRIEWVDIFKGIGITFVVIAHIWTSGGKYIFWFHMPLFFFISGYLYKSEESIGKYFIKKVYHLLIPYFAFLFLLSIPDYIVCIKPAGKLNAILSFTIKQIYGGRDIYGWFDVFWFVTCLFLTQQLFHIIHRSCKNKALFIFIIIISLFIYANICQYITPLRLPLFWGINIVPLAIFFFYIGHIAPEKFLHNKTILIAYILLLLLFILLDMQGIIDHELKMKWEAYGIPILNILLALSGIIIAFHLSNLFYRIKFLQVTFSELGKASLIIMFSHQAIRQIVFSRLHFIKNDWIIIIVTLACCYCLHYVFTLLPLTRKIFIGEYMGRD